MKGVAHISTQNFNFDTVKLNYFVFSYLGWLTQQFFKEYIGQPELQLHFTVCKRAPVKVQLTFMSVQSYIIYVVANRELVILCNSNLKLTISRTSE